MEENRSATCADQVLQVFLGVIERRVHRLIDLNQVSILSTELMKEKMEGFGDVEAREFVESSVSRNWEMGELLCGLHEYVKDLKFQADMEDLGAFSASKIESSKNSLPITSET